MGDALRKVKRHFLLIVGVVPERLVRQDMRCHLQDLAASDIILDPLNNHVLKNHTEILIGMYPGLGVVPKFRV